MIPVYHEPKKSHVPNLLGLKHTLSLKNNHVIFVLEQTDDVKIFISRFIPNNERSVIKHLNWSFAILAIIELDQLWHGAADMFVGARAWNKISELMHSYNLRHVWEPTITVSQWDHVTRDLQYRCALPPYIQYIRLIIYNPRRTQHDGYRGDVNRLLETPIHTPIGIMNIIVANHPWNGLVVSNHWRFDLSE